MSPVVKILNILATALVPSLGTQEFLYGSYTLLMVDLDIPPADDSTTTTERLHWMQSGLSSANRTSMIGCEVGFALVNPANISAFAAYEQPSPPDKPPISHRYVQYLLNTTSMPHNLAVLADLAMSRTFFNATSAVSKAGVSLVAGNWFNVSNPAALNATAISSGTAVSSNKSGIAVLSSSANSLTRISLIASSLGSMIVLFSALERHLT